MRKDLQVGTSTTSRIRILILNPDPDPGVLYNCTIIWEKGHLKHIQQAGGDDDEEGPTGIGT